DMYTQLVSVCPAVYSHILPPSLQHLNYSYNSPIIDMFPLTYELDMINKTQLFKCVPMIPYLDIERVKQGVIQQLMIEKLSEIDTKKIAAIDEIYIGKCHQKK